MPTGLSPTEWMFKREDETGSSKVIVTNLKGHCKKKKRTHAGSIQLITGWTDPRLCPRSAALWQRAEDMHCAPSMRPGPARSAQGCVTGSESGCYVEMHHMTSGQDPSRGLNITVHKHPHTMPSQQLLNWWLHHSRVVPLYGMFCFCCKLQLHHQWFVYSATAQ